MKPKKSLMVSGHHNLFIFQKEAEPSSSTEYYKIAR
jgi:hypothetical protein